MKKLLLVLAVIFTLASCSSTKVVSDQSSDINLSNYSTFEIVYQSSESGPQMNSINMKRVESAILNESSMRGLEESEEADLQIVWGLDTEIQRNYSTNTDYYSMGAYGRRGRYGGYGTAYSRSDSKEYLTTNGTLQIALVDKNTNELLWIGVAKDEIKGNTKKAEKKINKVINKVFNEFPLSQEES